MAPRRTDGSRVGRDYQPAPPLPPALGGIELPREEETHGFAPLKGSHINDTVSRAEFDQLREEFFKLERTLYGVQQMLGKAAEYQGKPRGRLPR